MKFQKTPYLYGPGGIYEQLISGDVKLPVGQWIRADETDAKPGRFVGVEAGGYVVICWPNGSHMTGTVHNSYFQARAMNFRGHQEYHKKIRYELEFDLTSVS